MAKLLAVAKLEVFVGGSKMYIPKKFYRIGRSKTYIPKDSYTKTTYTTLLSEKFRGSGAPPGPLNAIRNQISLLTIIYRSNCIVPFKTKVKKLST
ncbi:hypothetical protein Hanom_Chr10g00887971 [Helianthus anomalus]